jgi:hypothetical protein
VGQAREELLGQAREELVGQAREELVGQAREELVGQASVPVDGGKHKTPIEHTPEICKNQIRC